MAKKSNHFAFTEAGIRALPTPDTGRLWWYDTKVAALAVLKTSAGATSFYLYKWHSGKPLRMLIGKYPALTVAQARDAVAFHLGRIATGTNPLAERRAGRHEPTLEKLWDSYLEDHAKINKKSWLQDQRRYKMFMTDLATKRLSEITLDVVKKWHAEIGRDHGRPQANRCKALLATMFSMGGKAVKFTGENPVKGVANFPERSRERYLMPNEMQAFFAALALETPYWQGFFLVLLFTGCRRGNVQSMRWNEIDLVNRVWHIPGSKAKNDKPATITLCEPVMAVLRTRFNERGGSPHVFESQKGGKPLQYVWPAWKRIVANAGLADLHPHDLRRTMGSWQAAAGVPLNVIGKSLGHSSLASTAIYARLQLDPVRLAVSNASDSMIKAAGFSVGGDGMKMLAVDVKSVEGDGNE